MRLASTKVRMQLFSQTFCVEWVNFRALVSPEKSVKVSSNINTTNEYYNKYVVVVVVGLLGFVVGSAVVGCATSAFVTYIRPIVGFRRRSSIRRLSAQRNAFGFCFVFVDRFSLSE